MLACKHAEGIAAYVTGDHSGDECGHSPIAVVWSEHQRREPGEERHVHKRQHSGTDVRQHAGGTLGGPPDDDRDHGQHHGDGHRFAAIGVGEDQDRDRSRGDRDQRRGQVLLAKRGDQLPQPDEDGKYDDDEERRLEQVKRQQHQAAEGQANGDGDRQVAAGAAGRLLRRRHTSSSSASLDRSASSTCST